MAGQSYAQSALKYAEPSRSDDRITLLDDRDVENCFWNFGYENVFRDAAWRRDRSVDAGWKNRAPAKTVIAKAIEKHSKPWIAVLLLDAVIDRGPKGVPPPLRHAIECCVRMARRS
jgi:hypothetical protein